VKKLIAAGFAVAAVLGTSAALGDEYRVLGESLDSGLGQLPSTYTAEEFKKKPGGTVEWPFAV
jgi:hypothetical protein